MIYLYLLPLFMAGREGWMVPWNRVSGVRCMVGKQSDCQGIQAHDCAG